jgi:hypothetical protein
MAGNSVLSVGDIVKETGLTRQRIWQLAVAGRIPAQRANPNAKQHRFYDSAEFAAWRKQKARQSARPRASQVRRAYRISRRRQEKIEKPEHKGNFKFPRLASFCNIANEFERVFNRHVDGLQLMDLDEVREDTVPLYRFLKCVHETPDVSPFAI